MRERRRGADPLPPLLSGAEPLLGDRRETSDGQIGAGLWRWLAAGPIQAQNGGISAWCDLQFRPSFVYPEISGYLLTALAHGAAADGAARERVSRCASYLAGRVRAGRLGARPPDESVIYHFDLAMIATGLMRAHHAFGTAVLSEALQLVTLLRDQILTTGTLEPLRDRGGSPQVRKWSTDGKLHLAKCAQALLLAADYGLERSRDAADVLAENTLRGLRVQDRPFTCPGSSAIHLHAVLYCAEGLWIYGNATGDRQALSRAGELVAFVLAAMDDRGGLPAAIGGERSSSQSDVVAQAIRLGMLTGFSREDLAPLVAGLDQFVRTVGPWMAVEYQTGSGHLNSWSTIFAVQAHSVWRDGSGSLQWWQLA